MIEEKEAAGAAAAAAPQVPARAQALVQATATERKNQDPAGEVSFDYLQNSVFILYW